jgi:hypothetical protein
VAIFYGKLCEKHPNALGARYEASGYCVECIKESNQRRKIPKQIWAENNRDKVKASAATHREANRSKLNYNARQAYANGGKEARAEYRIKNSAKLKLSGKLYRVENKQRVSAQIKKHYEENRADYIMRARVREAHIVKKATPTWADRRGIRELYKACPAGHHVDHIIPLKNKLVCGLHVIANLQYMLAKDNLTKHNFYEVT